MTLIDLLEMICDCKASTMRHADRDIDRSLDINADRFGYGAELKGILKNTVKMIEAFTMYHHAEES